MYPWQIILWLALAMTGVLALVILGINLRAWRVVKRFDVLSMVELKHALGVTRRLTRIALVGIVGTTIVLLGLAMMVTPGPGLSTLLAGLAILATEFVWARTLMTRITGAMVSLGQSMGLSGEVLPANAGPIRRALHFIGRPIRWCWQRLGLARLADAINRRLGLARLVLPTPSVPSPPGAGGASTPGVEPPVAK